MLSANRQNIARYKIKTHSQFSIWADLIQRDCADERVKNFLLAASYYDFTWGAVAEITHPDALFVAIYPAEALSLGIDRFYNRFLTAYEECIKGELEIAANIAKITWEPFTAFFESGVTERCAFRLACPYPDPGQARFRQWFANRFLTELWPDALQKVMDPEFQFKTNWMLGSMEDVGKG